MINLEELIAAKEKRKTSLYYEEKEYFQYVFLHAISKHGDSFVLKGGTCLRIVYDFERASEDLDFSTSKSVKEIKTIVKECLKNFELLNIASEVYSEKESKGNIRFEIRFKGPLFNGNKNSTNTLKTDFNRSKTKNIIAKAIPKLFSDIPVFTIAALDKKEMLAEKIRALANRQQARDLYDIWMLLQNNVEIEEKLLKQKLKEEKTSLKKIRYPAKQAYETDLKNLLNYLPPYEQVKEQTEKAINKLKENKKN